MTHVIQTQQLITLRTSADDANLEHVLIESCQFFAAKADGVYQIDGLGWFAADGTQLLQEP